MPTKMIANRLLYNPEKAKEHQKGEVFTVETEALKKRLLRSKHASLHEAKPAHAKKVEPVVQKVELPETAAPVVEAPYVPLAEEPTRTVGSFRPARYRRSDMRSED